ncbi:hypothetical protein F5883DRAFT_643720 [Diaporthe sp. PMI_573]|nr:hypothetical protein F5883DRAFT_643720 [Diaporthaceae sp. PMI_573]
MAQNIPHFWVPGQAPYSAIVTLKDFGTHYAEEDVTWQAWEALCHKYFPESAPAQGHPYYITRRDPYRGLFPDTPSTHKPDVVVVKLSTPVQGADNLWRDSKRDVLWVECKAPCHDTPSMWKRVIEEATERLKSAHSDRNVWLIVAIGLKWMVFYWDPMNSRTHQFHMAVMMHDASSGWSVDPEIRLPPPPNPNVNGAPVIDVLQRYVDHSTGTIFTENACSLDFWTTHPNQPGQPLNLQNSLLFLENVFHAIQTDIYSGPPNPPNMS